MATPEEIRRARENTAFGGLLGDFFAKNRSQRTRLSRQNRRPVIGGLFSKEPVMGVDTLRYEGLRPLIGNLLEPILKGVDTVRAADQGLIPQEDILKEAFGATAVTAIGSNLLPVRGSVLRANSIRGIGDNGGPPLDKPLTKEQLDPLGYQKTKMRRPFSEVEVQQRDLGENLPRKPMSWEDMEGKVILPFYGDRTSRGLLVEGVNDYKFDAPVYTEGGVDFKVGPAAQKDRAIWASNQNIITRLSKEADKAQRDFGGRDILGVTGSMAPDANDFATFTGEAVAELVKGSKITKKTAKEFDKTMKALDSTFVGLLSPDLRDWVKNTSSPNRKSFIRLMDSRPMQDAGLPSPAEARKSVTDPTQYELPAGMFGLGVSRIDTGAPLMFNTPKGNKPTARVPHSTYNTQITGDYLGSLRPVPQRLIFKDVYDAISGKLDKRGNPLTEANMTHAIKTKMPAQELTPQIIDGILNYLARLER